MNTVSACTTPTAITGLPTPWATLWQYPYAQTNQQPLHLLKDYRYNILEINIAAYSRDADGIAITADSATTPLKRYLLFPSSNGPKRKASSTATGRAPMVNTSLRIPPTPVAAPW
jgi:hypothetical protein